MSSHSAAPRTLIRQSTRIVPAASLLGGLLVMAVAPALAAKRPAKIAKTPSKTSRTRLARASFNVPTRGRQLPPPRLPAAKKLNPLPKYVSLSTINTLRALRGDNLPVLQPFIEGHALQSPHRDLLSGPTLPPSLEPPAKPQAKKRTSLAQAIPRPARPAGSLPPAPIRRRPPARRAAPAIVPRFVRYPLEFQMAGIAIGRKAVDKDALNRIDRYGLFAIHGNPTAVVVPASGGGTVTVQQNPTDVGGNLFPIDQGGNLPDWASAVTVALDNNHVEWLYRRATYSMGFVVDRLGYVDAIVVAGTTSPIARTQLEDPVHTVKLGDDLRKVLFRYGYPDTLETYSINVSGSTTVGGAAAAATPGEGAGPGQGEGATPPQAPTANGAGGGGEGGAPAEGAAAGGGSNGAFRTFEVRYEQSYNIVFTIRNNRVVRMYIFGDPDFFNARRRQNFRTRY